MKNKAKLADHLLTTAPDLAEHAEAIMRAAGSSLRHYSVYGTRETIMREVAAVWQAGFDAAQRGGRGHD
ncbi:MAG: hypothetical protein WCY11_05125 [Novosphingobium sp.]